MAQHNELGKAGEQRAADYLEANGYAVVARNWKAPYTRNEIDIIAQGEGVLVIVEVKTRRNNHYGQPWEAVDWRKQDALASAANDYVCLQCIDLPIRFDIISIIGDEITHIKEAFTPRLRCY